MWGWGWGWMDRWMGERMVRVGMLGWLSWLSWLSWLVDLGHGSRLEGEG